MTLRDRSLLRAAVCLPLLVACFPTQAWPQRGAGEQERKATLIISGASLGLQWNGDQGESGRGRGEIYLVTLISWKAAVETEDPQRTTLGPIGGAAEFPSGTIVEDPPGSGMYRVEPGVVTELGMLYGNQADCPVPTEAFVYARVWEDDSNKDVLFYAGLILDAIGIAVETYSDKFFTAEAVDLVTDGVLSIIDWLTYSRDDVVGTFAGLVSFPDPCAGPFTVFRDLPLENQSKALWLEVNAEDENGTSFASVGIPPPDTIGHLKLRIFGTSFEDNYSSHYINTPPDTNRSWRIVRFDFGQPDECSFAGALDVAAAIPNDSIHVDYGMYLDTDHDIFTGAPFAPARGAEFRFEVPLGLTDGVMPILYRYDQGSGQFQPVAGALISSAIDLDRSTVYFSMDRSSIDFPTDSIAAWGYTQSAHGTYLSPPDPEALSPVITVASQPTGLAPYVLATHPPANARDVPPTDSLVVRFGKTMNRASVEGAFSLQPPTSGTFSWYGNRMTFVPSARLQPATTYTLSVAGFAQDCAGGLLDGNLDQVGGDPFVMEFVTQPDSLHAVGITGSPKGFFNVLEPIHASGAGFPSLANVHVYVTRYHVGIPAPGAPIVDVTHDGFNLASITGDGTLPATAVGTVAEEGEYNVIVDVNQNGTFDPALDRIDHSSIGFAVLPSTVDGRHGGVCDTDSVFQQVQTGFGDSNLGMVDMANGSELNSACAAIKDNTLHLFIAGNLESNFNNLELFFDSQPGGQNQLRGDNAGIDFGGLNRMGDDGGGNGLKFDAGFEADYWMGITGGPQASGYRMFVNFAHLPSGGGGSGYYLGETAAGGDGFLMGGLNTLGIRAAIDNSNTGGVTSGCAAAAPGQVFTGIELAIPLAALGSPQGCFRITMFVNGNSHASVSNQFLGPLQAGACNLGEPRQVDLSTQPGDQFMVVCLPPPVAVPPGARSGAPWMRAWPNPSRGQVIVAFSPQPGLQLEASVFDILGRRIRTLPRIAGGTGHFTWDGMDAAGRRLRAGIYLLRLRGPGFDRTARVLLLR